MKFLCQLVSNLDEYDYTQQLRKDLLFNDYIEQDCFKLAIFLDPRMVRNMLNQSKRDEIRERLQFHWLYLIKVQ